MHVEILEERVHGEVASESNHNRLRLKNILVPTDFSKDSVRALEYGLALVRQFDGILWLLHVVEAPPAYSGFEGVPTSVSEGESVASAEASMAEYAAQHVPAGIAVTSVVRHGSTVKEVAGLAAAREIDLVVISTHARTGLSRALYGSLAERILHHAPCPTLVVREHEHEFIDEGGGIDGVKSIRLRRILAPIDFSICSKKAVHYAEAFARQFGSDLFCVHVVEPEKPLIVIETNAFQKQNEMESEQRVKEFLNDVDATVHLEKDIRSGAPGREIAALAEEHKVDLIVLGEHRHSGMKRFLLGSTVDDVVKRAHCPVLVVREVEHEFVEV